MTCEQRAREHRRARVGRADSNHLLCRLVLPHQPVSSFQTQPRHRVEVVTAAQYCHLSKLAVCPAREIVFAYPGEVFALDADTVALAIELEDDCTGAKDKQIGILGDEAVDETLAFEVSELRICFEWGHNVL